MESVDCMSELQSYERKRTWRIEASDLYRVKHILVFEVQICLLGCTAV
jgi:hypothetical protein